MTDWDVKVITDSGFYKQVRVEGYVSRDDAEAAALGMTGAQQIAYCTPVSNYQSKSSQLVPEVVENHYYHQEESDYDDDFESSLDELEIEMYDLLCQIHIEEGKELPTIEEFYDYLNND